MSKYTGFILGVLMVVLAAAKPWGKINAALGIAPVRTAADSLATASLTQQDSLYIDQAAAIILPGPAADSLATKLTQKAKYKAYLEEQLQLTTEEDNQLKVKLAAKKKALLQKKQSLMSIDEIEGLVERQKKPTKGASVAKHADPTTGLLVDETDRKRPN